MSANNSSSSTSDSTVGKTGTQTPVTSAQSSILAVPTSTTTSRTAQPSAHSHLAEETTRPSQSPISTTNPSNTNVEVTSSQRTSNSSTPTTSYSSQKNRKLVPRSRAENEDRQNKASPSPAGIQQNQLLATGSSPSNNTYVIRDNEGRWFLLQTNAAPGTAVHQQSLQQQFQHQLQQLPSQLIKSNIINGNATLGQLARSLAPKPPSSTTPVSSAASSLLASSSTNGMAHTGSSRSGPHSSTTSASSSQTQPAVVSHYQTLRPASNTNPQLLTMINGYYVQQVPPNPPSASSVPAPTALVSQAKISLAAAQPTSITNQSAAAPPKLRLHPVTSITPAVKQPQLQSITSQTSEKWTNAKIPENNTTPPLPTLPPSGGSQNAHGSSSTVTGPTINAAFNGGKTASCVKAKGSDKDVQRASGAQVMFMSNGAMSQSGVLNGSPMPVSWPGSQSIRQQVSSGPGVSGQLLSVFQQQQNLPRFAPPPSSSHNLTCSTTYRRRADGDLELGVENEPPSIECHGESKEAHKVRLLFLREAQAFREKLGPQREIVHSVDGLEILESDTPFPPMPPVPLEEWMPRGPREVKVSAPRESKNYEEDRFIDTDGLPLDNDSRSFQEVSSSTSQTLSKSPSAAVDYFEKTPENKKKRKRKTNEVDRLLQMDFGPNEGRLRDIMENSDKNTDKKFDSKELKVSDSTNELSASPTSSGVEGKESMDGKEDKPSSTSGSVKEKKRRGRIPGKRNCKESEERQLVSKLSEVYDGDTEKQSRSSKDAQEAGSSLMEESSTEKSGRNAQTDESANATETSLNSSAESTGDLGVGVGNISLSDEDLDTERCIYCDGYLRVKRLISHPQYCSKKCRKLWKKNPLLNGGRSADSLPQVECRATSTMASSSSVALPTSSATLYTSPNRSAPVSPDSQQRPARTLILKMSTVASSESSHPSVLCQNQEDTGSSDIHHSVLHKSAPRVYLPSAQTFVVRAPQISETQVTPAPSALTSVHVPSTYAPSLLGSSGSRAFDSRERAEFPEGHPRTWSCDEVATWVTRVTGTDTIGEKFRNQDVDGQSLLLMAESEGGIAALLTQKLLLKLGPVLKLEKALKDLIARSNA